MSFVKRDDLGNVIRNRVAIDFTNEKVITEQSHKQEVDINNIIRRHANGMDLVSRTARLKSQEFRFDDVTGNDFQEAMFKINKAQDSFDRLPSQVRKKFGNNAAEFLDYVQNPENADELIKMGLANAPAPKQQPIEVVVINPETPPA